MSLGRKVIKARNKSVKLFIGTIVLLFLEFNFLPYIMEGYTLWVMLFTFVGMIFFSHKIAEPIIVEGADLFEQRMDADIRNND